MIIDESWLTDIQNAYSNRVSGRSLQDVQKPQYQEVSTNLKYKLSTTMNMVTGLVNQQINTISNSYTKTTGMLMQIAEINQKIDRGDFIGCRSGIHNLIDMVNAANNYNKEHGYEPILSEKALENLYAVENIFNDMFAVRIEE